MSNLQPFITNKKGARRFACSAVALQAVVVNPEEKTLLLSSPTRNPNGAWQVVSGALEAGETVLEGTLREAREELGNIRVRPLGTIHVQTFHYDENVQYMIAIYYLLAYEGGEVQPGDDMQGSQYRWWSLAELNDEKVNIVVPPGQKWILERAIELYRLWKGQTRELQLSKL
ncbi:MAG: NUDIX hydrolase [Anaerolineales bacterium]|nr:MAG: NUDIX hydrolase [Anaerolineales bacterium]WKZ38852.1 MAG: NUDIX hydrolase [Anaerolineales bacterium]